jgi:hypothetical protein
MATVFFNERNPESTLKRNPLVKGSRTGTLANRPENYSRGTQEVQNGTRIIVSRLTLGILRTVRPGSVPAQVRLRYPQACSGMLTIDSGKSGRCSGRATKTEAARMRLESDFRGRMIFFWWGRERGRTLSEVFKS